jgi:hypothetical protein
LAAARRARHGYVYAKAYAVLIDLPRNSRLILDSRPDLVYEGLVVALIVTQRRLEHTCLMLSNFV